MTAAYRADVDALLARVDEVTAPVCGACSTPLASDGPSIYWCDDQCSRLWHATQGEPLVGYVDPWHRPWDFPGIGSDEHVSAERRPTFVVDETVLTPPSPQRPSVGRFGDAALGSLGDGSGWMEVGHLESGQTVRMLVSQDVAVSMAAAFEPARAQMELIAEAGARWMQHVGEQLRPLYEQMRRAGIVDEARPRDPRERALAARRSRNTGPDRRGRAPRTIGRPSTTARRSM